LQPQPLEQFEVPLRQKWYLLVRFPRISEVKFGYFFFGRVWQNRLHGTGRAADHVMRVIFKLMYKLQRSGSAADRTIVCNGGRQYAGHSFNQHSPDSGGFEARITLFDRLGQRQIAFVRSKGTFRYRAERRTGTPPDQLAAKLKTTSIDI
jgi:hypothetical protein